MEKIRVWRLPVRAFHWGLVVAVTGAAITGFLLGSPWLTLHLVGGTAALALVLARIVWGLTGDGPARFSSFVTGPRAALLHLRGGVRHLGHNPLGGWMVLALMAAVLALGLSGAVALGGTLKTGPLAFLAFDTGRTAQELHEVLAIGLLVLVGLHLAGVGVESLRSRENLARSMVTGWKVRRAEDHPLPSAIARPGLALTLSALVALIAGGLGVALARLPAAGAPVAAGDALAACADCHMAYPPSLLPAGSWHDMMTTLSDHFGEDASLPEAERVAVEAYLVAHSAETADTKPAHLFRRMAQDAPGRISATPAWRRIHDDLPDTLFDARPIGSRANCAACHQDAATGWFTPTRIRIPAIEGETR